MLFILRFRIFAVVDILACALFAAVAFVAIFIDKSRVGTTEPVGTLADYNGQFIFFKAYGSMTFEFVGGAVLPTIQNDMDNRKIFPQSIFNGYLSELL